MSSNKKAQPKRNTYFDINNYLKKVTVKYNVGIHFEKPKTVNAFYAEIGNTENPRVTVIAVPGSPGSHNDFKYMKDFIEQRNIRFLCLNWPGSEFIEGGLYDTYSNPERNSYAKAVLETLNVDKCEKLILLGHSRGGENALQLATILAKNNWPIIGAAMINSPGFRPHRGISSRQGTLYLLTHMVEWRNKVVNFILFRFLDYYYNKVVHLRVANGAVGAAAMCTLTTFAFEKQKAEIEYLKTNPKIRTFYGYGSDDFLIEPENSHEIASAFTDRHHVTINTRKEADDVIESIRKHYLNGGQFSTANFVSEGHYLQKTYPEFLIKIIEAMVESAEIEEAEKSKL